MSVSTNVTYDAPTKLRLIMLLVISKFQARLNNKVELKHGVTTMHFQPNDHHSLHITTSPVTNRSHKTLPQTVCSETTATTTHAASVICLPINYALRSNATLPHYSLLPNSEQPLQPKNKVASSWRTVVLGMGRVVVVVTIRVRVGVGGGYLFNKFKFIVFNHRYIF